MSVEIREVEKKKELKTFVKLPFGIYKGNDNINKFIQSFMNLSQK